MLNHAIEQLLTQHLEELNHTTKTTALTKHVIQIIATHPSNNQLYKISMIPADSMIYTTYIYKFPDSKFPDYKLLAEINNDLNQPNNLRHTAQQINTIINNHHHKT